VLLVAIAASFAVVAAGGGFSVLVPWNPHMAFAWFPLFLLLCVCGALGRRADFAAAVFIGSALVQLHVGYVVLVSLPLAASAAWLIFDRSSASGLERWRRLVAPAPVRLWTAATLLLWAPPLVDQAVNGREGNLWLLVRFFGDTPDQSGPAAGWSFAAGVLGGAARFPFHGLGGSAEETDTYTGDVLPGSPWLLLPLLAMLGLAAFLAHRQRDRTMVRALSVAAATVAAGLLALARILGDRWPYLFTWRYVVVWFLLATVGVGIGRATRLRGGTTLPGRLGAVALSFAVLVSGAGTLAKIAAWDPGRLADLEDSAEELSELVLARGTPEEPVTLVRFGSTLDGIGDGLLDAVEDAGWDVGVVEPLAYKYGEVVCSARRARPCGW
jgi:hypothetical protein